MEFLGLLKFWDKAGLKTKTMGFYIFSYINIILSVIKHASSKNRVCKTREHRRFKDS